MLKSAPSFSFEFNTKSRFESQREIESIRSNHFKFKPIEKQIRSVWDIQPVDFTWKLFQPQAPKRNSREAIKPWIYDTKSKEEKTCELSEEDTKKKKLLDEFLEEDNRIMRLAYLPNLKPEEPNEFKGSFRLQTPNAARIEASKSMGYRESLSTYKIPLKYVHRPLIPINSLGLPEFDAKLESDPFNIHLKLNGLSQIHGETDEIKGLYGYKIHEFPKGGPQMGDPVLKQPSKYISSLILPKLSFPNRFYGYTRYRKQNRPVDEAVWERMLNKINNNWKERRERMHIDENEQQSYKESIHTLLLNSSNET